MGPAKTTRKEQMRLNVFSKLAANLTEIIIKKNIGKTIFTLEIFLSVKTGHVMNISISVYFWSMVKDNTDSIGMAKAHRTSKMESFESLATTTIMVKFSILDVLLLINLL